MTGETAKLDIAKLDEILRSTNVNYKKIKYREAFNSILFEVYFYNDDDLFKGVNTLNLRINEKDKMVYVIPFKKKSDSLR